MRLARAGDKLCSRSSAGVPLLLVEDGIRSRRGSDVGQKESGGSGRGGAPFCGGQQLEFRSPRRCEGEEKARRAALSAKTQALQATGWASERASERGSRRGGATRASAAVGCSKGGQGRAALAGGWDGY